MRLRTRVNSTAHELHTIQLILFVPHTPNTSQLDIYASRGERVRFLVSLLTIAQPRLLLNVPLMHFHVRFRAHRGPWAQQMEADMLLKKMRVRNA
jgi:hypothetical protein